jgi:hypothetical protein
MKTKANISLLKSNLQKAIRRKNEYVALQTALALIQRDCLAFLRRLAIIYIEDVCLTDSYPIVIWLMMVYDTTTYKISNRDIDILLHIVSNLAECDTWYNNRKPITINKSLNSTTHLQKCENASLLLAIHYRTKYGGMKCDMHMLLESIDYYMKNGDKIGEKTEYNILDYDQLYDDEFANIEILESAIDFHPFPQILSELSKITEYKQEEIKRIIWFSDSGINYRKPYTIEQSNEYQSFWKVLKPKIDILRKKYMN